MYAIPPRRFPSRATHFQGFLYDPRGSSSQFYLFRNSHRYYVFYEQWNYPMQLLRAYYPQRCKNNYVQLLTTSCVFCSIVDNYVIQGQGVNRRYYSIRSQFREILTGSIKYQGIDGYFFDNIMYRKKKYLVIRPGDGFFHIININTLRILM